MLITIPELFDNSHINGFAASMLKKMSKPPNFDKFDVMATFIVPDDNFCARKVFQRCKFFLIFMPDNYFMNNSISYVLHLGNF